MLLLITCVHPIDSWLKSYRYILTTIVRFLSLWNHYSYNPPRVYFPINKVFNGRWWSTIGNTTGFEKREQHFSVIIWRSHKAGLATDKIKSTYSWIGTMGFDYVLIWAIHSLIVAGLLDTFLSLGVGVSVVWITFRWWTEKVDFVRT